MSKTFFAYLPTVEGSVEEECKQCLNRIIDTCSSGFVPVKLNIFVDLPDFEALLQTRRTISRLLTGSFGEQMPAFNVTVQPPEKPWKVTIEGSFIHSGSMNILYRSFESIPYIILESVSGIELWAAGISSYSFSGDTRKAAENAFDLMVALLKREQMSLNNLVRQWNYIGNILTIKNSLQNYQIFNEVRNEYYTRFRNIDGYPAATGVGTKYGGVILDFCAYKSLDDVKIIAVNNPNQVNAYSYGQMVLKGEADKGKSKRHAPQFERALLISNEMEVILHISGTAAIIGQETIGKGDIGQQTVVTIGNIQKLTDNVRIGALLNDTLEYDVKYSLLRIYVKESGDISTVRMVCCSHFPQVPAVYVEADICRDDLLMEIEAEAVWVK